MSELAVTLLRFSYLLLLWVFILIAIMVLRKDIYGTRITSRSGRASRKAAKGRVPANVMAAVPAGFATAAPSALNIADVSSSAQSSMPTRIMVTSGPLRGTSLPLGDGPVMIGRSASANLVVDDDYASGRHAQIVRRGLEWLVEDLGSTNGTFVDNERVRQGLPVSVHVGSQVRIGQTTVEMRG